MNIYTEFTTGYIYQPVGNSIIIKNDCFEWLRKIPENSIHAIVTDPPYGVKEYGFTQLEKRINGKGGIWRIPPAFDGKVRSPLPRFTALSKKERKQVYHFFLNWGKLSLQTLRPGGHIFIASNTFLSQLVFSAIVESGFEFRGTVIRLVRTLRGGDRPKNAEKKYQDVCSLPRGCFEPWGLFRRPLPKEMKVSDCLREYQTGGLRRKQDGTPFEDVIESERTPKKERRISDHPSLKPQSFLRKIVYAALPLGKGIIVDPFMGSGSTIAAAEALGYFSIGVERHGEYFKTAENAILKLAAIGTSESQLDLFRYSESL